MTSSFRYKRLWERTWNFEESCSTGTRPTSSLDGDTLVARDGRRVEAASRHAPAPGDADQDHLLSPQPHLASARIRCRALPRRRRTSTSRSRRSTPTAAPSCARRTATTSTTKAKSPSSSVARARNIAVADAAHYIAGYTVANDYGLHDFRDTDAGSMLRVKGADTLCPIGPGLVTDWDFRHKSHAHAASTASSARTARPTRWPGTCTTSSPTSRASSPWCPAT